MSDRGNDVDTRAALEAAARTLEASTDFRVVRRLVPETRFGPVPDEPLEQAVVLDTETTGTRHESDRLVELALLAFEYAPSTSQIVRVTDSYAGLEDPGVPIPPEATAIHGITDAMVKGRALDEARVRSVLSNATLIVAHNAAFDRPFFERRFGALTDYAWACSLSQLPWAAEGFAGAKLEYLAWQSGFFFESHRSLSDCQALLELLRRPLPRSGTLAFAALRKAAGEKAFRLWAIDSPIDSKDRLRERGYRWDNERRCWHRTLGRDEARAEAPWLKEQIYRGVAARVDVETLDARVRYSHRAGPVQTRSL